MPVLSLRVLAPSGLAACIFVAVSVSLGLFFSSQEKQVNRALRSTEEDIVNCYNQTEVDILRFWNLKLEEQMLRKSTAVHRFMEDIEHVQLEMVAAVTINNYNYSNMHLWGWINWEESAIAFLAATDEAGRGYALVENEVAAMGDDPLQRQPNSTIRVSVVPMSTAVSLGLEFGDGDGEDLCSKEELITVCGTLAPLGEYYESLPCSEAELFDGTKGSGPCIDGGSKRLRLEAMPVLDDALRNQEPGTTLWGEPLPFSGFSGAVLRTVWLDDNGELHVVAAAFNLATVSAVLKAEAKDDERFFAVLRGRHRPMLIGASHGVVTTVHRGVSPVTHRYTDLEYPLHPTKAGDPVIRGVSEFVYDHRDDTDDAFETVGEHFERTRRALAIDIPRMGRWLCRTLQFSDQYGLDLWLVVAVDEHSVMDELRYDVEKALATEREEAHHVHVHLEQVRMVDILVSVAATSAACFVALLIAIRVTSPIQSLVKGMEEAALMHLEAAKDVPPTILSEVSDMRSSFFHMVDSLAGYREYLPASLLERNETTDDRNDEDDYDPHGRCSPLQKSASSGSTLSGRQRLTSLTNSSTDVPPENHKNAMRLAVHYKTHIAQARVGMVDFGKLLRQELSGPDGCQRMADFHSVYLQVVVCAASATKGSLLFFQADEAVVDFKGILRCGLPAQKAAVFAVTVQEGVRNNVEPLLGHLDAAVHVGAAVGHGYCGNIGADTLRSVAVVGEVTVAAAAMLTAARELHLPIVCNQGLADRVPDEYVTFQVDRVRALNTTYRAFCILNTSSFTNDAWIYDGADAVGAKACFSSAAALLESGQVQEAVNTMCGAPDAHGGKKVAGAVLRRVRRHFGELTAMSSNSQGDQREGDSSEPWELRTVSTGINVSSSVYLREYMEPHTVPTAIVELLEESATDLAITPKMRRTKRGSEDRRNSRAHDVCSSPTARLPITPKRIFHA